MRTISRRQLIGFLGIFGGLGGLAGFRARYPELGYQGSDSATFVEGSVIRTLLKDIPPESLAHGATLFHEHINQHVGDASSRLKFLEDVENMILEVRASGPDGVSCIVDAGHDDMGRNLEELRRIAAANASGVQIVASGGYYLQRSYSSDISTKTADQIADDLVGAANRERWGAFGEIGWSQQPTADERKVMLAVGKAHVRTGLPVFTHNSYTGTRPATTPPVPADSAIQQLDILQSAGVRPDKVALGHVCCLDEPTVEVCKQLARSGAFVGFDRATTNMTMPDDKRLAMALRLIDAGYANNLLLSSDFAFETSLKKNGGAGLAQTVTVFGAKLRQAGVADDVVHRILVDNPRRFLAFVPV